VLLLALPNASCEKHWDPVLADEAEKNGQNIDDFILGSNMPFSEIEMRMKLLHSCGYNVARAKEEYGRLQEVGWGGTKWTGDEEEMFKDIMESTFCKDFSALSGQMKRSRAECMAHYYEWKSSKESAYPKTKKKWKRRRNEGSKNDYCIICEDGGGVLVLCDRCDDAYHLNCIDPASGVVPEGDWFCPKCVSKKLSQEGGRIALAMRSSPAAKLWSPPTKNTALCRETNREGHNQKQASPHALFTSAASVARREGGVGSGSGILGGAAAPGLHFNHSGTTEPQPSTVQESSSLVLSDDDSVFSEPADV
jgi:hypothetical protein